MALRPRLSPGVPLSKGMARGVSTTSKEAIDHGTA